MKVFSGSIHKPKGHSIPFCCLHLNYTHDVLSELRKLGILLLFILTNCIHTKVNLSVLGFRSCFNLVPVKNEKPDTSSDLRDEVKYQSCSTSLNSKCKTVLNYGLIWRFDLGTGCPSTICDFNHWSTIHRVWFIELTCLYTWVSQELIHGCWCIAIQCRN